METRAQTQETALSLLNGIIEFNRRKHREYAELGFKIQREYSLDNYADMLSYMENCGNNLFDNEEAINELSDVDLLKLEQALKYTAEFIGLSTQNNQSRTDYSVIQADFPTFDYFNFPNPLEFFLYLIDPRGIHIRRFRNSFTMLSPSEQMDYLYTKYNEGMRKSGRDRGRAAKDLRDLRNQMKLEGLFNINERFMNVELRDFLNLNDDGTEIYTWDDVHGTDWREVSSRGTEFHQLTAPYIQGVMTIELPNKSLHQRIIFTQLNAKFCHKDGREAVFSFNHNLITVYPDKGTFNYSRDFGIDFFTGLQTLVPPRLHYRYDIEPYNNLMEASFKKEIEILKRENGGYKYNDDIINGNTFYWRYNISR
jgi:hypothetical protein